ncbi:hypothetical protein L202_07702 [Cryptococcus amylolentus CBS 6039]|uniref:3-dehydrosphinganine reductase n=1 Tax=Cryptococcus amylolentus CBS 6039 TaxID=1295533 RepID=A0A1E3HBH6_9TREE|nr:hypothetical protein L202_07702 [Cryptococcus amylolentus CBS 6039]ODN73136.1 hypothetical protein L202_07702 [Cryptococcus amylolentus CBS 6039]
MFWRTKDPYAPAGKHCYVTGGTQGLGKALVKSLVKQGAHMTIVARDAERGERIVKELQALGKSSQIIQFISADLSSADESDRALRDALVPHQGLAPEYTFLCAGFAQPKYFVEYTKEEIQSTMSGNYLTSAYTAHSLLSLLINQHRHGRLTFVSSFAGLTSYVGYSTYSPSKFAVRGLADALQSEMLLHDGIRVHLFVPCGILSEGYEREIETTPGITRKIEEADTPLVPEKCAEALELGLKKGHYQITDNVLTDIVRLRTNGGVPSNKFIFDLFFLFLSTFAVPIWRMMCDSTVRAARKTIHQEYAQRGFFQGSGTGSAV